MKSISKWSFFYQIMKIVLYVDKPLNAKYQTLMKK
jgi:hypothetical protein